MAITSYSELQAAVASWMHRDDLGSVIPDFIVMAEATFNYGEAEPEFPPLRCRQMETTDDFAVSSGSVALPSGFLEVRRITAATSPVRELEYASPDWLKEAYPSGQDASSPRFYTIEGGNILSVADFEMVYYTAIPDLATNTTNWLLTASPNAYLYTAMMHGYAYVKSPEKVAQCRSMALSAIRGVVRSDMTARTGVMQRRASGPAP